MPLPVRRSALPVAALLAVALGVTVAGPGPGASVAVADDGGTSASVTRLGGAAATGARVAGATVAVGAVEAAGGTSAEASRTPGHRTGGAANTSAEASRRPRTTRASTSAETSRRLRATRANTSAETPRRARAARRRAARADRLVLKRVGGRGRAPFAVTRDPLPTARAPLTGLPAVVDAVTDQVTAVLAPITGGGAATTSPSPTATPTPTPTPDPAPVSIPAVGVVLRDTPAYRATLSRPTVAAGRVRLQVQNAGEDPHDLVVLRDEDGSGAAIFPLTAPSTTRTSTVTLRSGTYTLFCTLTAPVVHRDAGMRATLVVSD
ncbi:hypothetical protein [Paraconexibacter algicola]|uniref:EfeO-type cupredoxin-like domain-containing protein n=1 Tax=Paraconexibacter algicola TaxID=2133960 RepID=A0A2T4UDM5_9ACTN|nr:hypothetical protein [Paraconexibacter algicola]PTL55603.1 hypothetical protein C7Y72_18370 [Paraconexibacter algicola]